MQQTTSLRLRVVIVEDEPLARERLCKLLEAESNVEIVGICEDGRNALRVVKSCSPDVVFLDVQMPEMDGFAFLQALPPASRPVVIIVTGQEKHAAKAFDFEAVDFLLKPFDKDRFRLALQRARQRIQSHNHSGLNDVVAALHQTIEETRGLTGRIAIKNDGRIAFIAPEEIDWIDVVGNYCKIHAGLASHMVLSSLTALEGRLPAEKFMRTTRSTLVNILCVKELRFGGGCSTILLQDGTELSVSATYRPLWAKLGSK